MSQADDPLFPEDDEAFLNELRSIAALIDPPPQEYLDYAAEALSFAYFDAEIGLLVETTKDSMAAVRDIAAPDHPLEFSFSDLLLSLSYTSEQITGSILPATGAVVRVMTRLSVDYGVVDSSGSFSVDRTGQGAFRVVVVLGDRSYSTDWIV